MENNEIIKIVCDINEKLKEDFLTIPLSFTKCDLQNMQKIENRDNIIETIVREVASLRYSVNICQIKHNKLDIFSKEIKTVIKHSYIAFNQGNYICSYLSLIPTIEALIINAKWINRDQKISNIYSILKKFEKYCKKLKNFCRKWIIVAKTR